jgi:hypothetical protein
MSKLPLDNRRRPLGGGFQRGWGLYQSADRGREKSGDPSGNTLTKRQKMASEDSRAQKNGQGYGDDDAKQPEDE